mgnify:CR=1 FL=1
MAENVKQGCTGDCMKCTLFQRQYCASQIAYNNMGLLSALSDEVKKLEEKVDAIISNEALINPIAQEASSAEEKAAEIINP